MNNDYQELSRARGFWAASHVGGYKYVDATDAVGNPVLWKYRREGTDDYTERKMQATLSNYLRPVTSAYVDFVLRPGVDRGDESEYISFTEWVQNVDGNGSTMDDFISIRARDAFVNMTTFAMIDSTATGEEQTAADASGVSYFARSLSADAVPYYRIDQNIVREAIVLLHDSAGKFGIYFTDSDMTRFRLQDDNHAPLTVASVEPAVPHFYGGCPVVILDYADLHLAADIAEKQKSIFNRESMLQEELVNSTYTTWAFNCDKPSDGEDTIEMGTRRIVFLGAEANGTQRLGADPAQAASLREAIQGDVTEIYRTAGLTPGNPVKVGDAESGLAKAFSFNELKSRLDSYAKKLEFFEETLSSRWAAATGSPWPGEVTYSREFDPRDRMHELELAIMVISSNLPDAFKNAQLREASKAFSMSPQERRGMSIDAEDSSATAQSIDQKIDETNLI